MNGVINKGYVVVVAVEACSFILGRSLAHLVQFSHRRERVGVAKGDGPGRIERSAS